MNEQIYEWKKKKKNDRLLVQNTMQEVEERNDKEKQAK